LCFKIEAFFNVLKLVQLANNAKSLSEAYIIHKMNDAEELPL